MDYLLWLQCYLDAKLVICGSIVEFSACDDGEDVTVLQI